MRKDTEIDVENIDDISSAETEPSLSDPLEEKYVKQMRQIYPQKIELPISTLRMMIKEQIKLNPDFQRRDRWDNKKRSRFVESIIMNVPIPPVFLGEDKYGQYVVLDGRQRLTAIHEFLKNSYPLEGLEVWSELNEKTYNELEQRGLDKTLTRRFIPAVLLLKESSPEVKYDVFDRLNTGGVEANPMEIRNAIFQGPFNRLLHKVSGIKEFRALWNIPEDDKERMDNTLYSQMGDVQLALRFFALSEPALIQTSFKRYLGKFMGQRNTAYEENNALEQSDFDRFSRAVTNTIKVFGAKDAFVREVGSNKKSAPLADAVMISLADVPSQNIDDAVAEKLKGSFNDLIQEDTDFKKSISSGTNGKGAIALRVSKARELVNLIVKP